jgi:glycosyltransferase involved in cell wall biosynthesis
MTHRRTILVAHPSALLTDSQPHGDGLAAHALISELARRGHRLHVAVPGTMDVRRPFPGEVILHRLLAPDAAWTPVTMAVFMLRLRGLADRLDAREGVDVIHQLNPVATGITLGLPRRRPPLVLGPFVGEWSDAGGGWARRARRALKRSVKNQVLRLQGRRADLLLLSTPAAAGKLPDPDAVRAKLRVLSYGIDVGRFRPGRPPAVPTILFLGRVEPLKGIFTLLDAFDRVAEAHPSARLVIAGAGAALPAVRARLATAAWADRVEIVGTVSRAQVPEVMAACSVYCQPSFGEPFGLGALEAMACGRPVVGTAAGGLAHLVPPEGGRLVAPGNDRALAEALSDLLASPALCERIGRHNRRLAEERYAWDRIAAQLEQHYEELIGSRADA